MTVEARDLKDEKVELTTSSLKFSANAEGVNYTFEINFFGEVVVEVIKLIISFRKVNGLIMD